MKLLILISILSCNLAFSQVGKKDNEVELKYLDLSAVNDTQIRITRINYLGVTHVLEIFLTQDNTWYYRIAARLSEGLAVYEEDTVSDSPEQILSDLKLLKEVPDQRDIKLRYPDDSEMSESKVVEFFQIVMDGSAYIVEVWDQGVHREIRYENPEAYIELLRRQKFSTIEHERFLEFISYYERIYGPLTGYDRLTKALKYGGQDKLGE